MPHQEEDMVPDEDSPGLQTAQWIPGSILGSAKKSVSPGPSLPLPLEKFYTVFPERQKVLQLKDSGRHSEHLFCLSRGVAHCLPGPCQVPTFLKELGAPGAEAVISRPLDVPVLARSGPAALTAHTG